MSLWYRIIRPITGHFRQKRGTFIKTQFPNIASWRICDLGGSRHFWEKLAITDLPPASITIYNISGSETQGEGKFGEVKVVIYDGQAIPAADGEFDLLVCNSVLEHVPLDKRVELVAEMRRVAKNFFIQTPAYEFPFEPHFIMPFVHWFPKRLGFMLIHFSPWRLLSRPTSETIKSYWYDTQLLSKSEIEKLFPSERIECEGVLGFTKSYYIVSLPS